MVEQHSIPFSLSPSSDDNSSSQDTLYADTSSVYFQPPQYGNNPTQHARSSSSSSKKPRGRPPGSRNKLKPPMVITLNNDCNVKPAILEFGCDTNIMEGTVQLARRRNGGISVLNATGIISDVAISHPLNKIAPYTLHGPFALSGLSGSYLTPTTLGTHFLSATLAPFIPNFPPSAINSNFGISLTGIQGNVFGGVVAGKAMATANGVTMTTLLFNNPEYHRFGVADGDVIEEDIDNEDGGGGVHGDASGFNRCVSANRSYMHAFGAAPAQMSYGGFSCFVRGTGSSGSGVPMSDLTSASAPMGYSFFSDPNVMHWGQVHPGAQPPN